MRNAQTEAGEDLRRIGFFRAMLFTIWGPADLGPHSPLAGTKYDPAVKKAREQQRQQDRRRREHL